MKTRVVITVDTEASIAGYYKDPKRFKPLIHEPVSGDVKGVSQSIGFLIRTLKKHSLSATFFVETLQSYFFQKDEMGAYVSQLVEAKQDVQLHLHPTWLHFQEAQASNPERASGEVSDHCSDLDRASLEDAITHGCDLLERWTGYRPTSMRTGNFSTDRDVFAAAHKCGLITASNLNYSAHLPSETSLQIAGGITNIEGVWEFPVTNFSDIGPIGKGKARPLQITSLSFPEQVNLLNHINQSGGSIAVIITHPFEFTKRQNDQYQGLTQNRLVQHRFQKLCAFLAENKDRFDVVTMADLGKDQQLKEEKPLDLKGNAALAFGRAICNFVNDRL